MEQSEEDKTKTYELTALVKNEETNVLRSALQKIGASLLEEKPLVKMQLQYPILKEQFAFQAVLYFTAPEETIAALQNDLNFNKEVIRYVVKIPRRVSKEESRGGIFERGSRERARFASPHEPRETRKPEILTNEALEKKIEEILQ